jgi:hypothetical protein
MDRAGSELAETVLSRCQPEVMPGVIGPLGWTRCRAVRRSFVIGKVVRGADAGRLLYYLFGPGRANEHVDPRLVAGFGDPIELAPVRRQNGSFDLRRLTGLLAQPLAAVRGRNYDKPVWHCSVRAAPGDREVSDGDWAQAAVGIMNRTGLAPEGDELGVRWVAVRHAADHIHLVATLARQDGYRPKIWNDFYRVREACRDAEPRLGLEETAPADRTAARRATRAETEHAARRGWAEPARVTLRREVCAAAAAASSEHEFFARLKESGVLVLLRFSTKNPGEVTGYAVGVAHHTTADGAVVWYSGGKLAADLTLPKLRYRWNPRIGAQEQVPRRIAGAERGSTYHHAARSARAAAEHVRHCSATDPARGADAAWATADVLHIAALVLRSQELRRAAGAFDRAARTPYGRIADRTRCGDQLRQLARALSAAPHASSATDLIVSLASLAAAVADLRTAQQHATQAAAARRAAEHLHQVAHNRSTNAPTRRREHARASDLARADSPGGLKLAAPAAETAPATPRRAARPAHQRARPPPR